MDQELEKHFVYVGNYYDWQTDRQYKLRSFILKGMKKYNIKSLMVTNIHMWRYQIITKETMENYYKGYYAHRKKSVNDDLKALFEDVQLGKEPDEYVQTYFTPKLTEKEVGLVETKDSSYLATFYQWLNPDVKGAEMKISVSDSKFVEGWCYRRTFKIENSSSKNIFNCYS